VISNQQNRAASAIRKLCLQALRIGIYREKSASQKTSETMKKKKGINEKKKKKTSVSL